MRRQADRASNELICAELRREFPTDAVLSEEGIEDHRRLQARRVWIVDPLDGTREFGEEGRDDYAVHVALAVEGDPLVGAVALPGRGLLFSTGQQLRPPELRPGRLRVLVSRTRKEPRVLALAQALDADVVEYGSAGAKAMAVLLGEAEVYAHAGGQHEWDSAAPVAVARAAGLHTSRLDGAPLIYNQPDPYLPDLVICHPAVAPQVLDCLARIS